MKIVLMKSTFTSSLMTVALLSECRAVVILRPKSAKTILMNFTQNLLKSNENYRAKLSLYFFRFKSQIQKKLHLISEKRKIWFLFWFVEKILKIDKSKPV